MIYTKDSLKDINGSYHSDHFISDLDVIKANRLSAFIEESRNDKQPVDGDRVIYTNKYGNNYSWALFAGLNTYGDVNALCENYTTPFVNEYKGKVSTSASGGSWPSVEMPELKHFKLIDKKPAKFCAWGHCGMTKNGAFDFEAVVNIWRYKEKQLYKFPGQKGFSLTLLNGNGNYYQTKRIKICIATLYINDVALEHIKKNTGLLFEKATSGYYWAVPKNSTQIVQLLTNGRFKVEYYNNADWENTFFLRYINE